MWTPDVYEGSPTPVTAFFATAPKVAAMALIARLVQDAFGAIPGQWGQVLAVLAVLSMFLGAVAAIGQRDIKRLMAYSSIAHMGYALIGLAVGTAYGVQATLIYMAIYVTMNVGTFAFILSMERDGRPVTDIASLNQFARKEPLKALAVLVLMFSLAGVPPMVGFFGKFYVLKAAVDAGMVWLAVAGRGGLGDRRLLLPAHRLLHVFRAEQEPVDSRMAPVQWAMLVAVAAIMVLGVVNLFGIEPRPRRGRSPCPLRRRRRGRVILASVDSTNAEGSAGPRLVRAAVDPGRRADRRAGPARPALGQPARQFPRHAGACG
jgi:NADH-quinone oxidoreductase subunit N